MQSASLCMTGSEPAEPTFHNAGEPGNVSSPNSIRLVQMALQQHAAAAQLCEAALVENSDDWAAWQMLMDCQLCPGPDLQASGQLMFKLAALLVSA